MADVVELARELVAIPSHEDPSAVGAFIERWLRAETAAEVTRDEVGNVFARLGDDPDRLALVGHHDVVPPDEDQVDSEGVPTTAVRDGRLYGRGSADMKGAVAAMLLAVRDVPSGSDLVVASFVGEETGGVGARHAVESGFRPDRAVIGEGSAGYATPGALDVVVAHRGRRGSTLEVGGEAGHASRPDVGVNAIYRAIDVIGALRDRPAPTATLAGEQLQGSLAVTGIEAGMADNVIPDRCTVTLDERTVPGHRLDIDGVIADRPWVDWEVTQDWPPMACSDDSFATAVRASVSGVQDRSVATVTKPHATDASWLAEAGTATVVVGPAERDEAHTADESVDVDLLETARDAYIEIARSV